ncbi:flavodoxin family protein [Virgibacillus kekensis]|uniref:Flavodoxin family protein n=1 Tax=Virgibacillus kekensis TaxID=202261 RepID=A0ABV9DHV7_9BACI
MSIAVIYGSTRADSNTELLTEQAIQGLDVERIILRNYAIQPIEDGRHAPEGFKDVKDDHKALFSKMVESDIIIFSTPIYWYGMSGTMKNFVDRWSHTMRDPEFADFKERMAQKQAFLITAGGDDPYLKGLPLVQQFKYICDFVNLPFGGYVLGKANKPGEIKQDKKAMVSAEQLNEQLKVITQKTRNKKS